MSIEFRNKLEVNTINFNFDNKEKVKDLYIHDSEYVGFSYDYDQRKVFLSCDNAANFGEVEIVFMLFI